jgi:hypothetical protein
LRLGEWKGEHIGKNVRNAWLSYEIENMNESCMDNDRNDVGKMEQIG